MLPGAQRYGAGLGRGASIGLASCVPGRAGFMRRWVVEVGLMRRVSMPVVTALAMAGLGSVLLAGAGPAVAGVPSAGGAGGWDKAIEVPGTAALNKGGEAEVLSVSCAAAGGCAAGGQYRAFGRLQAFVVTEADGRWRKAIEVPGTAALNKGGNAEVSSVSCAA